MYGKHAYILLETFFKNSATLLLSIYFSEGIFWSLNNAIKEFLTNLWYDNRKKTCFIVGYKALDASV